MDIIKDNYGKLFSAYKLSIKGYSGFDLEEVKEAYDVVSNFVKNNVDVEDEEDKDFVDFILEYFKYLYLICQDYFKNTLDDYNVKLNFKFNIFRVLISIIVHKKEVFKNKEMRRKYVDIFEKALTQNFSDLRSFFDYSIPKNNYKKVESLFLMELFRLVVMLILKKLNIKFGEMERKVAHYTRIDVADFLINGGSAFRMNSTEFMNDPTEGGLIRIFLNLSDNDSFRYQHNFLSCFTFNHNYLNQFRLYGRTNGLDGTGISLVIDDTFFSDLDHFYFKEGALDKKISEKSSLPLFRCCYFDPDSGYISVAKRSKYSFFQELRVKKPADEIEEEWRKYMKLIKPIESDVRVNLNFLKTIVDDLKLMYPLGSENVWSLIDNFMRPINYLFKHSAFKEEEECRIIKITNLDDKDIKNEMGANGVTFTYIEYSSDIKKSIRNVYIGPASAKYLTYFKVSLIKHRLKHRLKEVKICVSENPLRTF